MPNLDLEDLSPENARVLRHLMTLDGDEADSLEIYNFWTSPPLIEWFSRYGYTLYKAEQEERFWLYFTPRLAFEDSFRAPYPYAHYDANAPNKRSDASLMSPSVFYQKRVVFAQDTEGRHVAIKLVRTGSEEYRILRFLHKQSLEVLRENCILPVLDFLYFGRDTCFVVLPRWGDGVHTPQDHTMREILFMIQSMLKGLAFLHSHNIVHRDMKPSNCLINHFVTDYSFDSFGHYRTKKEYILNCKRQLRFERRLEYALIDFDLSTMLPAEINKEEYRESYTKSWVGTWFPPDTMQGEFDFNPFAYDVATLGRVLCELYQHHTKDVHFLAPFLDGMVTRDVEKRFTADEALRFLENMIPLIPEEQLNVLERPCDASNYERFDRWEGLPEDFQKQWTMYRAPVGVPFTWKVLRRIRNYEIEFRGYEWMPFVHLIPSILNINIFPRSYTLLDRIFCPWLHLKVHGR